MISRALHLIDPQPNIYNTNKTLSERDFNLLRVLKSHCSTFNLNFIEKTLYKTADTVYIN